MKKLMLLAAFFAASVASAATIYDGETYTDTKSTASSKSVYVQPTNVVSVANRQINKWWTGSGSNDVERISQMSTFNWFLPREIELDADIIEGDPEIMAIDMTPGVMTTVLPVATTNFHPGVEIGVKVPRGEYRNFEVYLPNEPNVRTGLPVGYSLDNIPNDIRKVYINNTRWAHKLPARIILKQPYKRLVIGEIVELDDGEDWSPIITAAHLKWTGSKLVSDGPYLLEGTNLHSGVTLKYAYTLLNDTVVTNVVDAANANVGYMPGTFYNYTTGIEFTPPPDQQIASSGDGDAFDITIIYETRAGLRPAVFTVSVPIDQQ